MSDGIWIVYDYNSGPYFIAAFPTAEDALKLITRQGYGKGCFVRWGESIRDAEDRLRKDDA